MLTGGFMLLITGSLLGEWNQMHPNQDAIIAIVYLIFIGSILSYGCYMYILKRLPSAIVSTYAYINTMVAVFLGYLFLSESLTFDMLIGVLFTIAGVWIVTKNFSPA
jgi:drug/metabolite transporter (DMT)-like permease